MHSTLFNSDEGLVFAQPNRFHSAAVQLKSDFFILASSSIHPKLIYILGDFMFKSNFRLKTEDISCVWPYDDYNCNSDINTVFVNPWVYPFVNQITKKPH